MPICFPLAKARILCSYLSKKLLMNSSASGPILINSTIILNDIFHYWFAAINVFFLKKRIVTMDPLSKSLNIGNIQMIWVGVSFLFNVAYWLCFYVSTVSVTEMSQRFFLKSHLSVIFEWILLKERQPKSVRGDQAEFVNKLAGRQVSGRVTGLSSCSPASRGPTWGL